MMDFAKEKEKGNYQTKIVMDSSSSAVKSNLEAIPTSASVSPEFKSLVREEVQKAVAELRDQSNFKDCPKKKRNPVHIRNPDLQIVLKFRKGNEPLKDTLSRAIRAAGKYLEMTGDTEVH
jgi:Cu2+-containing amine oxidase